METLDLSSYSTGMSSTATTITIIFYVLQIIAYWKMFTKAGEAGWKSLIPIYNLILLCNIIGISPLLILLLFTAFIPIVGLICVIYFLVKFLGATSRSYGHGTGFAILMFFFSPICYLYLGFGPDEYVGPNGNPAGPMHDTSNPNM